MDQNVNNLLAQEEIMDRLIAKAEKLKGLIDLTVEPKTGLPNIVYSVNLGDLRQLVAAPGNTFSEAFREELENCLRAVAHESILAAPQPKTEKAEKKFKPSSLQLGQA